MDPVFESRIKRFIKKMDSLEGEKSNFNVINVMADESDKPPCKIYLGTGLFYDANRLKGHLILEGWLVAFYSNSPCVSDLVDYKMLNLDTPPGKYRNQDDPSIPPHEPTYDIFWSDKMEALPIESIESSE